MINGYDDLSPEALTPLRLDDPTRACRLLQNMAGHQVPDAVFDAALRPLVLALAGCADPDRAISNLARWADNAPSRLAAYALLADHPPAAEVLVTVMAASQFFADLLIQTPETLETLTNSRLRRAPRPPQLRQAEMTRRVLLPALPNARRDALRQVKGPEILRIGVRDLLGEASFAQTVADISAFADACVRLAWDICRAEQAGFAGQFAVLALGKLGGQELNYSSDIDLVFVHGDETPSQAAVKMGECIQGTLAKQTGAGFVFRVDLRLRPEGRFGPVSRSLASCRAYYESWAEPWERQALMKARFVAGDPALGAEFVAMTQDFVYPPHTDAAFVQSIQANKQRLEQKIASRGEAEWNVKEGVGGIRDVEFAVQLMTLVAGGAHPEVRSGSTLDSLARLTGAGLLSAKEGDALREAYIFLRTVEHRLQLLDEQAVRVVPQDDGARRKLARRMGFADLAGFDRDYRAHTRAAHTLFVRLFYGAPQGPATAAPDDAGAWALALPDPAAQALLAQTLTNYGFQDAPAALLLIARAVQGSDYGGVQQEARDAFARLLGPLLEAAARTRDPDGALRNMDALADAMPSRAAWLGVLQASPRLLPHLAILAGDAPALWRILLGHLEFLDMLADEPVMDAPYLFRPPPAIPTLAQMATDALRARLHVGARDIWGLAAVPETLAQTTRIAEALTQNALLLARQETGFDGPFTIVALGKAGGSEMAYSSDVDALYVAAPEHLADAARLAARTQQILRGDLARYGVALEMDARLRPHGRDGALVLDLATYQDYYAYQSQTWERQMLVKACSFAGDETLGQAFVAMAHTITYTALADETAVDSILAMKLRWERERLKDPLDIKLGPGGLSDIEWTCQLLQMQHGAKNRRVRLPGTLPALRALRDDALLTQADWEVLSHAYSLLATARNHAWLRAGVASDVPPHQSKALTQARQEARAVCLRLFFGNLLPPSGVE